MRRFVTYLFVFVVLSSGLFAQQSAIATLNEKINKATSDTQKVNLLNKLYVVYSDFNSDSALLFAQEALKLSFSSKFNIGKASSYNNIGAVYYYKGNNTKALSNFLSSIKIIESELAAGATDAVLKKLLSSAYNNLGTIYHRQKQYRPAEAYFRKSIAVDEAEGNKAGTALSYNNIGAIKEETGNNDEAIRYYEIALKIKEEAKDTAGIPSTLINMGIIRMNQNKFKESQAYFDKALWMSRKQNNKQDLALALLNMGDMLYLKKDYNASVKYYLDGANVCKEQQYLEYLIYAYNSLSLAYYEMKDFQKAYEIYNQYSKAKDSVYTRDNARSLQELQAKYQSEASEKEIKLLTSEKEIKDLELNKKRILIYVFVAGLILLGVIVLIAINAYRQKHKANNELDAKNKKIEYAYKIIEEKQREIVDSINYAKRIQHTLLAHDEFLKENIPNHFIFFNPKDIVSGDFYWATRKGNKFYLAVCDSTGHGVPGAFMSLLNIGFLSEAINEKGIEEPNKVLNFVRQRLIDNINKEGQQDGFDGILLCMEDPVAGANSVKITYAAANNAPAIVSNGVLSNLNFDRMPVGIGQNTNSFNLYNMDVKKGDTLYLYTDGYADQFGGPKGKKFKYKQLNELLLTNVDLPLTQQQEILRTTFENWRGNLEQIDDVCVIGVRV